MVYRVIFSAQAERDLGDIVRFLAQRSPAAAERLGHALLDTSLSLSTLPHRGVAVPERPGFRRLFHPPWFLLFYLVDRQHRIVAVVRIWDVRRDPNAFWLGR